MIHLHFCQILLNPKVAAKSGNSGRFRDEKRFLKKSGKFQVLYCFISEQ